QIKRCTACGFKFTSPRPNDEDLGQYYKAEDYISHSDTRKGLVNTLYHWVRSYTLIKKLQLVMQHTKLKRGKILDYGSGTGAFLNTCKKNLWEAHGIEQDEKEREKMEEKLNISSYNSLDSDKQNNSLNEFNLITTMHVLE